MNSRTLLLACIFLSFLGLAIYLAVGQLWSLALLALLIGLAWALPELLPAERRLKLLRFVWLPSVWFSVLAVGAAWIGISSRVWWLALALLLAALAAWDLSAFRRRAYSSGLPGNVSLRSYRPRKQNNASETEEGNELDAHSRSKDPAVEANRLTPAQMEQAAFERAHLRSLGWVIFAGAGVAVVVYLLAGWLRFPAGLGPSLALVFGLALLLILLARLLGRS